mmetsp:Transcript_73644/g.157998  ORF Transcript_73644/g.157998 Transcript_73644/m.157998 type:complete len:234 (+) Transcript_73644:68-769(+)
MILRHSAVLFFILPAPRTAGIPGVAKGTGATLVLLDGREARGTVVAASHVEQYVASLFLPPPLLIGIRPRVRRPVPVAPAAAMAPGRPPKQSKQRPRLASEVVTGRCPDMWHRCLLLIPEAAATLQQGIPVGHGRPRGDALRLITGAEPRPASAAGDRDTGLGQREAGDRILVILAGSRPTPAAGARLGQHLPIREAVCKGHCAEGGSAALIHGDTAWGGWAASGPLEFSGAA